MSFVKIEIIVKKDFFEKKCVILKRTIQKDFVKKPEDKIIEHEMVLDFSQDNSHQLSFAEDDITTDYLLVHTETEYTPSIGTGVFGESPKSTEYCVSI